MTRKGTRVTSLTLLVVSAILVILAGCKKESTTTPPARSTTYTLKVADVLGVTGTATFTETSSTVTTITITLQGAPVGSHPAELCANSIVEGGPVILNLNNVDTSGKSTTTVTAMTYSQLIAYDGFIRVLKSPSESNVILAQGDIGGNVITSTNMTYILDTVGSYNVMGTALFEKRVNGSTLITISLTGTIPGDSYPATINLGSVQSVGGGPVVATLNLVEGTTGKSYTNIKKLDSGVAITFENWMVYDGYINIYQGSATLANIICHGNIGSNQ